MHSGVMTCGRGNFTVVEKTRQLLWHVPRKVREECSNYFAPGAGRRIPGHGGATLLDHAPYQRSRLFLVRSVEMRSTRLVAGAATGVARRGLQ